MIFTLIPCYTDYVANLTLVIDDETLRQARVRALEIGTSVNQVVRDHLERFASDDAQSRTALERLVATSASSKAGSGAAARTWTRDQLYDERLHS